MVRGKSSIRDILCVCLVATFVLTMDAKGFVCPLFSSSRHWLKEECVFFGGFVLVLETDRKRVLRTVLSRESDGSSVRVMTFGYKDKRYSWFQLSLSSSIFHANEFYSRVGSHVIIASIWVKPSYN